MMIGIIDWNDDGDNADGHGDWDDHGDWYDHGDVFNTQRRFFSSFLYNFFFIIYVLF